MIAVAVALFEPELNPDEKYPQGIFKAGGNIRFRILATNTSIETVAVRIMGPYDDIRPELRKNGELIKYSKRVADRLESNKYVAGIGVSFVELPPGDTEDIGAVDLSDWYALLEPGTYKVVVKRRIKDEWVESSRLDFEVRP